jgi:hypothetical protein
MVVFLPFDFEALPKDANIMTFRKFCSTHLTTQEYIGTPLLVYQVQYLKWSYKWEAIHLRADRLTWSHSSYFKTFFMHSVTAFTMHLLVLGKLGEQLAPTSIHYGFHPMCSTVFARYHHCIFGAQRAPLSEFEESVLYYIRSSSLFDFQTILSLPRSLFGSLQ